MDIYFIPFLWHQLTGYICSTIHNYITFTCSNSDEKNNCTMSNVYIYIGIIIIIIKKRDRLYKLRRLWQKKTHPRASSSGNSCNTIWVKQIKSPKSGNKEKEIRQIPTLKLWTVYDSRRGSFRQIKPLLWFICKGKLIRFWSDIIKHHLCVIRCQWKHVIQSFFIIEINYRWWLLFFVLCRCL